MFQRFGAIKFHPIVIMVEGDVFFEEFVLSATPEGKKLRSRLLRFSCTRYKIKSLRLYLDRLEIAGAFERAYRPIPRNGYIETVKGCRKTSVKWEDVWHMTRNSEC